MCQRHMEASADEKCGREGTYLPRPYAIVLLLLVVFVTREIAGRCHGDIFLNPLADDLDNL